MKLIDFVQFELHKCIDETNVLYLVNDARDSIYMRGFNAGKISRLENQIRTLEEIIDRLESESHKPPWD